jgi:hypothetical protein
MQAHNAMFSRLFTGTVTDLGDGGLPFIRNGAHGIDAKAPKMIRQISVVFDEVYAAA